jgi:probable rRNA maturation factor
MTPKQQFIYFHFPFRRIYLPARQKLKKYIVWIFKEEQKKVGQINYIFCSDKDLLRINQAFLKHNTLTDIITFHYQDSAEPVMADIYISIERIKENSKVFKVSQLSELYRVMFHGALHLCGYSDKSKVEKHIMKQLEDKYLNKYVPRGTRL